MAGKIKATDAQLDKLYQALKIGAPINLALQSAGISQTTYYYWVAVASVVAEAKSQQELEELDKSLNSGISLQTVRDLTESLNSNKRSAIGTFIEPTAESLLQYKNNKTFRKFANQVYEIVTHCNELRSEVAIRHIGTIVKSTQDKRINASGSMWWLERSLGDQFAKPADKGKGDEATEKVLVEPVVVEYVDPTSTETKSRVAEMEESILKELKGGGPA